MTQADLQLASDFVHRWAATSKQRRGQLSTRFPVAAIKAAALEHPDLAMKRFSLFLLDHYASDASWDVFRRALGDPVAWVREVALHGLSCKQCRSEALCVADVVTDLVAILPPIPAQRFAIRQLPFLARFASRDERAAKAIGRAARNDADLAIRHVAKGRGR